MTGKENVALRRIIAKKIAAGVKPEQIIASMQGLGDPVNCREIARHDIAVATPLYAGPESKITLFDGGLKLHVEGSAGKKHSEIPLGSILVSRCAFGRFFWAVKK